MADVDARLAAARARGQSMCALTVRDDPVEYILRGAAHEELGIDFDLVELDDDIDGRQWFKVRNVDAGGPGGRAGLPRHYLFMASGMQLGREDWPPPVSGRRSIPRYVVVVRTDAGDPFE
eukprot:gene6643-67099_t